MEAYRIDRFGSIDGIVLRSSEHPRPGLKEILMQVRGHVAGGGPQWAVRRHGERRNAWSPR